MNDTAAAVTLCSGRRRLLHQVLHNAADARPAADVEGAPLGKGAERAPNVCAHSNRCRDRVVAFIGHCGASANI